jgi:hypothetical protein
MVASTRLCWNAHAPVRVERAEEIEMSQEKEPATRPVTEGQTGESGGGPYPNPHRGKEADAGGFKSGQSDQSYYGDGQLGDKELAGNENARSTEHGSEDDE